MAVDKRESWHFDTWLQWCLHDRCNLNCVYCHAYNNPIHQTAEIPKINIPSLLRTLEKTGKTFIINFVGGGEPFLVPNLIEACVALTKKHYVAFHTNLVSGNIKEFAEKINPEKVYYFIASLHIKELERLNLLDKYIGNFLLLKEKGFEMVCAIEVAYPPLLNQVKKYKKFFKKKGIELKFNPFIGQYNNKEYPVAYTKKELETFDLTRKSVEKFSSFGKICNAGYNVAWVCKNGNVTPCINIKEDLGNLYKEIKFKKSMIVCPFKFCICPQKYDNPHLFEIALKENAAAKMAKKQTRN